MQLTISQGLDSILQNLKWWSFLWLTFKKLMHFLKPQRKEYFEIAPCNLQHHLSNHLNNYHQSLSISNKWGSIVQSLTKHLWWKSLIYNFIYISALKTLKMFRLHRGPMVQTHIAQLHSSHRLSFPTWFYYPFCLNLCLYLLIMFFVCLSLPWNTQSHSNSYLACFSPYRKKQCQSMTLSL